MFFHKSTLLPLMIKQKFDFYTKQVLKLTCFPYWNWELGSPAISSVWTNPALMVHLLTPWKWCLHDRAQTGTPLLQPRARPWEHREGHRTTSAWQDWQLLPLLPLLLLLFVLPWPHGPGFSSIFVAAPGPWACGLPLAAWTVDFFTPAPPQPS